LKGLPETAALFFDIGIVLIGGAGTFNLPLSP